MRDLKHSLEGLSELSEGNSQRSRGSLRYWGGTCGNEDQSEYAFRNEPRGLISLSSRLTRTQHTGHVGTMKYRAEGPSRDNRNNEIPSRALNREGDPIRWCRQSISRPKYGDKPATIRERR
jgi:hypothetical protein